MKRTMMIFGFSAVCLLVGMQRSYACTCTIGTPVATEDPIIVAICDEEISGSATAQLTCDGVGSGTAEGSASVKHVPGEKTPSSITFTVSGTCSHGTTLSTTCTVGIFYDSAEGCTGCRNAGNGICENGCVRAMIYLGHRAKQRPKMPPMDWLYIYAPQPGAKWATPEGLSFVGPQNDLVLGGGGYYWQARMDLDLIRDANGIRQVMEPECFVDIVTNTAYKYSISFYTPNSVESDCDTNGLYVLKSGSQPFSVWTIENPNPSDNNTLRLTHAQGGETRTNEYQWEQDTNGVVSIALVTGGGLRNDSRSTSSNDTEIAETRIVMNDQDVVALKEDLTYRKLSNGNYELAEKVIDPDGAALTTTVSYYDDEGQPGSYGKVSMVVNPDGSWQRNNYNAGGMIAVKTIVWQNAAINAASNEVRIIAYDYQPVYYTLSTNEVVTNGVTNLVVMTNWPDNCTVDGDKARTETEYIEGKAVAKTYRAVYLDTTGDKVELEEKCSDATAQIGDETNLRTVRIYCAAEADSAGSERIKQIDYPDGRRDSYAYEYGMFATNTDPAQCSFSINATGEYVRVTCVHGTTDSEDGIANKTTKDVTIENHVRQPVMQETYVYTGGSSYTRVAWVVNYLDSLGRPTSIYKSNGTHTEATWGCCGKEWEKDENGVEYSYTYDALKRVTQKVKHGAAAGEYPAQSDQYTTYTYDAEGRMLTEVVSASSLSLGRTNQYDMAGRMTNSSDFAGLSTKTAYSQDGLTTTETLPGGFTRITERYKDGQMKSITGTAQISQYYEYGVTEDGTKWTKVFTATADSPVWVKTTTDLLGRTAKVEQPGYSGTEITEYTYNSKGRLIRQTVDSGQSSVVTLYAYDEVGNQIQSGLDVNGNGVLDFAGIDRISESDTSYVQISSDWFLQTVNLLYATDNSSTPLTNSVTWQRLTGFTANLVAETITIDAYGNQTVSQTTVDQSNKKVTQTVDIPDTSSNIVMVAVNGLVQSQTSKSGITTTFAYDALSRRNSVTDPRLGASVTHYESHGWVDYVEDAGGRRTSFTYDASTGRKLSQTDALSNVSYYAYSSYGQLEKTWGSAAYPVRYEYDGYGRMVKMHTYRGGSGWSSSTWPANPGTADTTEWVYHEVSGLLTAKKDAAGKQVSYTYSSGGKLASRTWSRVNGTNSLVTSYSYNDARDLSAIDYSDGTPDVSFTYDRLGRQKTTDSSVSAHTFAYNGLLLDTETIVSSAGTNVIDRSYDGYGRSTGFDLGSDYQVSYGFDSLGRFSSVSSSVSSVSISGEYSYLANSDLISSLSSVIGSLSSTTTRTYEDHRNLLTQIKNQLNSTVLSQFDYANDAGGRRTSIKYSGSAFETGAAFNKYEYNNRSEVTVGNKYWGANLNDTSDPVTGQSFAYAYDNIGNRNIATKNGNTETYTANTLNQYTQKTVPNQIDIIGSATTGATVTLNSQSVSRHGKYWYKNLTVTNTGNAVYQSVNVMGIYNPPGTNDSDVISTASGHVFAAKTPEVFTYDDDGNLLSGGRFNYSWECENRLIGAETLNNLPASVPRKKLDFAYDYMSRRASKTVYNWVSNDWSEVENRTFLYDSWNLIQEIVDTPTLHYTNTYVWGLDLSGSLQGAGGIGGLVSVTRSTSSGTATYFPCYDGNGNITDYVDTNGVIVAHREYDAFGNTVVATGPMVKDFSFWFSTKYLDHETGLYYYGYRYYSPSLGRFLSRDPIGEWIEYFTLLLSYGFVDNSPVNYIDYFGLLKEDPGWTDPYSAEDYKRLRDGIKQGMIDKFKNLICPADAGILAKELADAMGVLDAKSLGDLDKEFKDPKTSPDRKKQIEAKVQKIMEKYANKASEEAAAIYEKLKKNMPCCENAGKDK